MPFPRIVRFNAYELNLHTAELRKHGLRIKLQRQPSHILVLLVTNAGRMVSREELRKSLWPDDTFVDFDHGLNNAINRIREVLCDSIASPRYIETIPKQGYRFLATLEELESAPAQARPWKRAGWRPRRLTTAALRYPKNRQTIQQRSASQCCA